MNSPINLDSIPATNDTLRVKEEDKKEDNTRNDTRSNENTDTENSKDVEHENNLNKEKILCKDACGGELKQISEVTKTTINLKENLRFKVFEKIDSYFNEMDKKIQKHDEEIERLKKGMEDQGKINEGYKIVNQEMSEKSSEHQQKIKNLEEILRLCNDRITRLENNLIPVETRKSLECYIKQFFLIPNGYEKSPVLFSQLSSHMLEKVKKLIKGYTIEATKTVIGSPLLPDLNKNSSCNYKINQVTNLTNIKFSWKLFREWFKLQYLEPELRTHALGFIYEHGIKTNIKPSLFKKFSYSLHS